MFGVKVLIEKLNTAINSGSLTETQLIQAFGAIETLEKQGVSSVLSVAYLPNVVENKGRFFWLQTEQRYVVSNGTTWSNDNIFGVSFLNLYAWGSNASGKLGDNTTATKTSPVAPSASFTFPGQAGALFNDWVSVSAGIEHTLALRSNGTIWAWGLNTYGRLGDNTVTARSSPVSVVTNFRDWISVSGGLVHSLGLRANGTLYAWGRNLSGELGDGTTTSRRTPVVVVGGFTDWVSISASYHNLGVRANGTLYAWGYNTQGQLGDNSTSKRSSPVPVIGGFTDWISASAGRYHSLGLRANGTLWAWGLGSNGRLGDNTTSNRSSPVSVVGGFTDWVSESALRASAGIRANGTLYTWGANSNGELGHGTTSSRSSPVLVVGGYTDWASVSVGFNHMLGIRANGVLLAWGSNGSAELGDTTFIAKSSPISVAGGIADWVFASAGNANGFAIRG